MRTLLVGHAAAYKHNPRSLRHSGTSIQRHAYRRRNLTSDSSRTTNGGPVAAFRRCWRTKPKTVITPGESAAQESPKDPPVPPTCPRDCAGRQVPDPPSCGFVWLCPLRSSYLSGIVWIATSPATSPEVGFRSARQFCTIFRITLGTFAWSRVDEKLGLTIDLIRTSSPRGSPCPSFIRLV